MWGTSRIPISLFLSRKHRKEKSLEVESTVTPWFQWLWQDYVWQTPGSVEKIANLLLSELLPPSAWDIAQQASFGGRGQNSFGLGRLVAARKAAA